MLRGFAMRVVKGRKACLMPRRRSRYRTSATGGSVPQSKRDDDIRRFRLVQLEARPVVVAPAGEIHDLSRLGCRPGGLDRFHDVEPMAVEEERVLPEQAVESGDDRLEWSALRTGPKFARPVWN